MREEERYRVSEREIDKGDIYVYIGRKKMRERERERERERKKERKLSGNCVREKEKERVR